jgi:hypothetical protein
MVEHPEELLRFRRDVFKKIKYGNIVMCSADVNIRDIPNMNMSQVMKVLRKGEKVQHVGIQDGWNKVKFPGESADEFGWVSGDYLV